MGNKQIKPTGYRDYVTVSDASKALGVSIDTVRRWDRAGKLTSTRLDGKNRYFSVQDLQAFKAMQPLSTSEVAKLLKVSPSTVRRMEQSGQLQTVRGSNGHRGFSRQQVEANLADATLAKAAKIPVRQESTKSPAYTYTSLHINTKISQSTAERLARAKHKTRRAFLYGVTAAFSLMAILFLSFMVAPSQTNRALSFSSTSNVSDIEDWEQASAWERMLKPFSDGALYAVKMVSPSTFKEVTNQQATSNTNNEKVDGKEPGDNLGNLAVLPLSGSDVVDQSITNSKLAAGSVRLENLDTDVVTLLNGTEGEAGPAGPIGPVGPAGSTTSASNISSVLGGVGLSGGGSAGSVILGVLTGQGTKISGNAVEINIATTGATATTTSVSGLELSTQGLRLIGGCGLGELLKWNGSSWACATDTSGAGSIIAEEGGITVTSPVASLNFLATDFTVTDNTGQANISLDYTNSGITRRTSAENVTSAWSFLDNGFALRDDLDTTKQTIFDLSGITTGTVRTLIVPNVSGTIITSSNLSAITAVGTDSVVLGASTTGGYVSSIGSLTGLTTTGNSGEGSTPTLSVLYGSGVNNAAAGSNSFTCSSGSGNLSGGGTVVTIGTSGTTCATIDTVASPSFTSVSATTFTGALFGNSTTATALQSNPTDCGANQFATAISANGNLSCAILTDSDIPNSITIDLASAATALASNPTDCAANQFTNAIAANGNLTCANITDTDVSNTLTASLFVGTGSSTNAIDLETTEVAGNLRAYNLQSTASDLGATNITVDLSNTNGSFNTSLTVDGTISAGSFIGAVTGNADTATALVANPTDCSANQFATAIAANGNLSCATLTDGDVPDSITVTLAATATALASNPTDCAANQFANVIAASGNLSCSGVTLGTQTSGDYVASFTAGNGLTGSASGAGSAPTLAVVSANGAIVTNADNIALTVQTSGDALSSTLSSGSGLEVLSSGLSLLQGCADSEILKWNETTDVWACATDTAGGVTDADKGDITVSSSGASWNIDADAVALGTDTTGNYVATITAGSGISGSSSSEGGASTIALGNLTADWVQSAGFNISTAGNITATTFIGALTGNSSTATALASNPTDCAANQVANAIATSGDLACAALTDGDVPNSITIDLATTATALQSDPSDCAANQFATTIVANGNLTCATLTDGDIPDGITITLATTATALAANPTDCSANQFANAIATSGNLTCASLIDADIPNSITIDLATAATALAANPSDCSANQFAVSIVAAGNLTCAAITDTDIPNTITVDVATTASALASNPSDCSVNQFATTIAANGNLTCASITDADVADTLTASILVGSGSTSNAVDLATAEVAGNLQATSLQNAAADLGAANVTIDFSNTNGAFNTNITTDGTITATSFIGAITGNASTATALAANPSDCSANEFANAIVANGNLTCAALTDGDIPNSITVDVATAATALQSNPTDCSINQFATAIAANGNLACAALTDADIPNAITIDLATTASALAANPTDCSANQFAVSIVAAGNLTCASLTDADIPNSITVDTATTAGAASTATALAANPTDCSANQFANAIAASGNLSCASITDADVSDTLTASLFVGSGSSTTAIDLATAEVAGNLRATNLQSAGADLGAANVNIDLSNTNGAFNTNLTLDGSITAASFIGAITGNADTATALAANPSDCSANQFATTIAANGNLTCATLTDADVPNSITIDLASSATALASNPSDCSANQFANAIAASGNLTCAVLGDSDIPNSIIIDLATAATALASNPADCSANQFAIGIIASGDLSCAGITDADVSDTLTASLFVGSGSTTSAIDLGTAEVAGQLSDGNVSNTLTSSIFVGSGSTSNAIDLATAEVAGNLVASNLQSAAADLGAANVTVDFSNTNGAFNTNITTDGSVTASSLIGALTGNASTASALAANPTDCSANQFANAIASSGDLTCAALTDGDVPNSITIDLASTATALAANPSDCSANQFATVIAASGNLTCAALTDGDIPDGITITLASSATALAGNPTDCGANQFATTIAVSGNLTCASITDADVSNTLTASLFEGSGSSTTAIDLATAEVAGNLRASNLQSAAADLGAANVTIDLSNTNGAFNTNITTDGSITAGSFVGAVTGNASTATALAANPTDCSANQFANAIAASGNLSCASITDADVSDTLTASLFVGSGSSTTAIDLATAEVAGNLQASNLQNTASDLGAANVTIDLSNTNGAFVTNLTLDGGITAATFTGALTGNASTATALAANPSDCSANQFANAIVASGNLTCAALADADVPDGITISLAATATALAANPADCSAGQFANTIAASGALTCAAILASNLPVAAADLGGANVNLNFGNTNGAFNTNLTLDGTITIGSGLTVSAGGVAITGNSSITGTLTGLTGLTVASGGATITSGDLTLTAGSIITSNLGVDFTDSDTNPSCAAGNYKIYADTSETKLKKCENGVASDLNAIPDVNSFVDTTTEAWVDADTTNLWDGAAPNITPKSANSEVLVMMSAYINTTSATDVELTAKIMRHTSAITCQSVGTTVWTVGTQTGFTAGQVSMNAVFVDAPGTASNVQYTLCTDADSEAVTGSTMNTIQFTLFEVNDAADLAEVYPTNDNSLSAGEVVTMDSSMSNGVKRSSKAYDSSALGIVSTKPALAIGGRGGEGVGGKPIALSGRVPVKVSAVNGAIKKGDVLTSSSIPGVAMKATKAGAILGVAMSDFSGEGTGSVMTFVKTAYYNGANLREILESISGESVTDADYGKSALTYFMNNSDTNTQTVDMSDITTDRLAAGLEIVTPKVTANEVNTAKLVVGENGISFVGQSGESLATLDITGNLSAKTISAQSLNLTLDMFANGALTVLGSATFNGTALFNQLVTFKANTLFEANIDVNGTLTLGSNAGGYASVNAGQQTVRITFSQPHATTPVVGVSLGGGKFASYSYNNLTASGFDIVLSEPANEDLQFSWTATSIKNPITFAGE